MKRCDAARPTRPSVRRPRQSMERFVRPMVRASPKVRPPSRLDAQQDLPRCGDRSRPRRRPGPRIDGHGGHADAVVSLRGEDVLALAEGPPAVPAHPQEQGVALWPAHAPGDGHRVAAGGEGQVGDHLAMCARGLEEGRRIAPRLALVVRALVEDAVVGRARPDAWVHDVEHATVGSQLVQRVEARAALVGHPLESAPTGAQDRCREQGRATGRRARPGR